MDRPLIGGGFRAPELMEVWRMQLATDNARAAHNNIFQVLGEHGFLGLAIYLTIILLAFKNLAAIMLRARHVPELAWARKLAIACGISLTAYMVAGLTVSIPYYDLFIVVAVFVASLHRLVAQCIAARETERSPRPPGYPADRGHAAAAARTARTPLTGGAAR